jgi:hypothetical protein
LIPQGRYDPRARDDALEERKAITVFTTGKEESSPQPLQPEARQRIERISASPLREAPSPQVRTCLLKARENIVLAAHYREVVQVVHWS